MQRAMINNSPLSRLNAVSHRNSFQMFFRLNNKLSSCHCFLCSRFFSQRFFATFSDTAFFIGYLAFGTDSFIDVYPCAFFALTNRMYISCFQFSVGYIKILYRRQVAASTLVSQIKRKQKALRLRPEVFAESHPHAFQYTWVPLPDPLGHLQR